MRDAFPAFPAFLRDAAFSFRQGMAPFLFFEMKQTKEGLSIFKKCNRAIQKCTKNTHKKSKIFVFLEILSYYCFN